MLQVKEADKVEELFVGRNCARAEYPLRFLATPDWATVNSIAKSEPWSMTRS